MGVQIMAKWLCYADVRAGKYLGEVEAATEEEAKKKAWALNSCHVSACCQCSDDFDDPQVFEIIVEKSE